jgi:Putative Flp pilus-assembly TadE/G-like
MSSPSQFDRRPPRRLDPIAPQRGQMLAIFAIALVAVIAMVGLIIDGGDTFLQRRDQQNVADAAAMAAGYASVNGEDPTDAAQTVALANGYEDGVDGVTVTVTVGSGSVKVDVSRPHKNYFSGIVGFASWGVSTTASVAAGIPNGAYGAMPLIFNKKSFDNPNNKNKNAPAAFDEPGNGNQDVPQTDSSFNWTVFCTANGNACNADTRTVNDIIDNNGKPTTVYLDDLIGPLNAGSHTALFNALASKINNAYPVAIVNDAGAMVGWAWFHLTGSVGGSTKQISGWFEDQVNAPPLVISGNHTQTFTQTGTYAVYLTN